MNLSSEAVLEWRPRLRSHISELTLDLLLCLITSYTKSVWGKVILHKKNQEVELSYIYDLNYFGPRGFNKLQSGSRGVALFFSSFTGIWLNWYKGALQRRETEKQPRAPSWGFDLLSQPGRERYGESEQGRKRRGEKKTLFPTLSRLDFIRLDILVPL